MTQRSPRLLAVLGRGVVDPDTPVVRADDLGVTRGDGCFEGIRVRTDASGHSEADKLDRHLARMSRSAAALDIPFEPQPWRELIATACAAWTAPAPGEAAMKLVLTRGPAATHIPTGYLTIVPMLEIHPRQRREGIAVITLDRGVASDAFVTAPWLLGGVKTLSYAVNMAAQREAERRGVDDVIFVSSDGFVLEAPTGSVVWANGRVLSTTPTAGTGILAGTTQQLLFDDAGAAGWRTQSVLASLDELHAAEAVWLISSVRGPVEIVELDGKARPRRPDLDAEIKKLAGFGS
jgi:4-amino-4-deoxychorismate lyase